MGGDGGGEVVARTDLWGNFTLARNSRWVVKVVGPALFGSDGVHRLTIWNFDKIESGVLGTVWGIPCTGASVGVVFPLNSVDSLLIADGENKIRLVDVEATCYQKKLVTVTEFGTGFDCLEDHMIWNGNVYTVGSDRSVVCMNTGETTHVSEGSGSPKFIGGPFFVIDNTLRVFSVAEPSLVRTICTTCAPLTMEFGHGLVAVEGENNRIEVIDVETGFLIFKIETPHKMSGYGVDGSGTNSNGGGCPCTVHNKLNCHVSNDTEELQRLHEVVGWTPGREHVRPLPENKQRKAEYMANVLSQYASPGDYVLSTVFGFAPVEVPVERPTGEQIFPMMLHVPNEHLPRKKIFDRNMWSYQLPEGTRHFLMWYTWGPADGLTQEEITRDIHQALSIRVRHGDFEFIWYENPKMTIPNVYHVVNKRELGSSPAFLHSSTITAVLLLLGWVQLGRLLLCLVRSFIFTRACWALLSACSEAFAAFFAAFEADIGLAPWNFADPVPVPGPVTVPGPIPIASLPVPVPVPTLDSEPEYEEPCGYTPSPTPCDPPTSTFEPGISEATGLYPVDGCCIDLPCCCV
ncbi:hypothetical protein Pelo_17126 [Pelomyxa schiedti]|nr:hypothetical protein Pelo_17126 [Pelomyxa schiedti]